MLSFDSQVALVAEWLDSAAHVAVSTGAGMSAESGISTFRDQGGVWSQFDPAKLATPEGFATDRLAVWQWYRARRAQLAAIEPHDGHRILARWEARLPRFDLITQNVDGLHDRAGSREVIELHGRLDTLRCIACDHSEQHLADAGPDPSCPQCGQPMRPGVVWFGEALPEDALDRAFAAAQSCDILILIGTSGVVEPAASLAWVAKQHGAKIIEINPTPTPLSDHADQGIRHKCRESLAAIEANWINR